jgi:hypothetical protein
MYFFVLYAITAPVSAPPAQASPRLLKATPMLVSDMFTPTNRASTPPSPAKKKPHDRITNGSPVMIRTSPIVVRPRLYER